MIVTRGWGLLTLFIPMFAFLVVQSLAVSLGQGTSDWVLWGSALLGGAAVAALGLVLNRPRVLITEVETGDAIEVRVHHDLFWIPMQYWGLLLAVLGAGVALAELL